MERSWLDRHRQLIVLSGLGIALIGGGIFYWQQPAPTAIDILPVTPTATLTATPTVTPTPAPVRVYVTGAIVQADVYFLPPGSIVKDLIAAAGGLTPAADIERFNQALELQDQQHIHIPRKGETDNPPFIQEGSLTTDQVTTGNGHPSTPTLININTASLEQLDTLPGIGPALANKIIEYRQTNGDFKVIEDIIQVNGIGDTKFSELKDLITVE